jgi:hypothetical protein
MTKNFNERLKAIEQRINARPGAGIFRILRITGGLPGPINFAYAGEHRWDRDDGEEFEAFVRRSADAAIAAGEMAINVGGLPRGDEFDRFKTAAGEFDFEAWWATVAPYYPEVPDCEPDGYVRKEGSRW